MSSCKTSTSDLSFNIKDWSPKIIEQNLLDYENDEKVLYKESQGVQFQNSEIYDETYANNGLLVIKTADSKIGFYSLIYNDWLVNPIDYSTNFYYSVSINNYVGFTLTIRYGGLYFCYDALGNEIYGDSNTNKSISFNKNISGDEEYIYCYTYDNNSMIMKYDKNGVLNSDENNDNYQEGDLYEDINIKKEIFGISLEGYKFSHKSKLVTIFNEDGDYVTSYSLPDLLYKNTAKYFCADTSIIYQTTSVVANDADDYDYCILQNNYNSSPTKYVLKSYKFDILTGKCELINLDYIINENGVRFNDKKGKSKYSLINASFISEDKIITDTADLLVDEDGKIIANATGFAPNKFIKLENGNYYNIENKILYDSSLKVIAHLAGISPIYYKGIGFVGIMDGKYGVLNEKGSVVLKFEYDLIDEYIYNNKVIAIKNSEVYKLDFDKYVGTYLSDESDFIMLGEGLYAVSNSDKYIVYDLSGELMNISKDNYSVNYHGKFVSMFGKYKFFSARNSNNGIVKYKILTSEQIKNLGFFKTQEIF